MLTKCNCKDVFLWYNEKGEMLDAEGNIDVILTIIDETEKAIEIYQHASFMIPCRFLPIYELFEINRKAGHKYMAVKYANEIVDKKVKIPSLTVNSIKSEAEEYLRENKITFGNT